MTVTHWALNKWPGYPTAEDVPPVDHSRPCDWCGGRLSGTLLVPSGDGLWRRWYMCIDHLRPPAMTFEVVGDKVVWRK